jgi:hypothetical protein
MSFRLSDKPVVKVPKELRLERDQRNQAMVTNGIFEIDIPPTITPTINGNGKTVQIDYKLCVTVFLPEMGAYNQDREVSVNLDVVIGTVYENGSFDISNEIERLSISSNDSTSAAAGGGYVIQTDRVGNNNREMPSQNDYVQRNVTHQSPTTYYIPDQMLGHSQSTPPPQPPTQNNPVYPPYPVNTGYTPVPTINTGIPPQTPTHGGYPPNTHPGFSPSTNQTYQEFRGNREENRSSIKYQTIPNITPETTPPRKPQQLNIYPPPDNFEHELPMALNSHDEEVMNLNRKIEKSVYPPLQHDSEPMDMASPACYMDQYPNQYFEFQESASDENTTLS